MSSAVADETLRQRPIFFAQLEHPAGAPVDPATAYAYIYVRQVTEGTRRRLVQIIESRATRPGFIYAIWVRAVGPAIIKLGRSRDPFARARALSHQLHSPARVLFAYRTRDDVTAEALVHAVLWDRRVSLLDEDTGAPLTEFFALNDVRKLQWLLKSVAGYVSAFW